MAIDGIISQFAEDAAFLWYLRTKAVAAPHFTLNDLALLDERVDAHLDGLRVAGDAAWNICAEALDDDCVEGIFPAAVLVFEAGNETRIASMMEAVERDRTKIRALISALGWLRYEQAEPHIKGFLAGESSLQRYVGIAASAIHRHDPGGHLEKAACDAAPSLKARALRAYGELGRSRELNLASVRDDLRADDDGVRFYAAWSAAFAGNVEAVEVLKTFVVQKSSYREKALQVALRLMGRTDGIAWQKHLSESTDTIRLAVLGAGIIGDTSRVPWLLEQMNTPELARVAGEALTMITGVDIELAKMKGVHPEGFTAGPNDDPQDDNVAMDVDQDLPWPDAELIAAWWHKQNADYPSGVRYLLGKPISPDNLRRALRFGYQRQRSAAALELAMMNPAQPLFEVRAPAFRQTRMGWNQ